MIEALKRDDLPAGIVSQIPIAEVRHLEMLQEDEAFWVDTLL